MAISANLKCIIDILSDGAFHSGTELAAVLGISRSAVCKQIQILPSLGIELMAVSGKGYRLERPLQLLSLKHIERYLSEHSDRLLKGIEIHDLITSTNSYLLQKTRSGNDTGLACFAEYQSAGKGRRGRDWVSPFGSNIYLSILWRYQSGPGVISGLSLALGVAVIQALNELGIENTGLKWPNDIYWQGKKLAGILIEVSGESNGPCHAVIGLGLNGYISRQQAGEIDQAWVDMDTILGTYSGFLRNRLAAELLNHMLPVIAEFENTGLDAYLDAWREMDCMRGAAVTINIGQRRFQGVVEGIDDTGLLLIRDNDGVVKAHASGEVSFRPA